MSTPVIVSYDGTPNDDDALVLGAALSGGAGGLALAYVRHSREIDPRREELARFDAERRLGGGRDLLGGADVATHVLLDASTGRALDTLARAEAAHLLVFGSDYRTAPGRAEPGNTAQRLLDGGPFAIAIARAGLRLAPSAPVATIAAANPHEDPAVEVTVATLAARLDAEVRPIDSGPVDLIVVGSQRGAPAGSLALSGSARAALNAARGSVLVLARERPLAFEVSAPGRQSDEA